MENDFAYEDSRHKIWKVVYQLKGPFRVVGIVLGNVYFVETLEG
jgi:hypothetical protein